MVRDRVVVIGIIDLRLQERLLRMEELDLQKAIDCCRAAEQSKKQAKTLQERTIDVVNKKNLSNKRYTVKKNGKYTVKTGQSEDKAAESNSEKFKCCRCNKWHAARKCPAYGRSCTRCGKLNHFATCCKVNLNKVSELSNTNTTDNEFCIDTINVKNVNSVETWYETITVENVKINFKLDSGLKSCMKLNLIKRVDLVSKFNTKDEFIKANLEMFNGLGTLKDKCKIELNENCKPFAWPPRRVPLAIKDKLKSKLAELEARGIITKVEGNSEWVTNFVIVEKPDKNTEAMLGPPTSSSN
ncbi:hypothetical protein QE152_g1110 [Popillia japonica]|uniref:Polyprotein n=1 Tax=Popillia japonica TaxID=7064 RepID=A0AAW1N6A7_POPJA